MVVDVQHNARPWSVMENADFAGGLIWHQRGNALAVLPMNSATSEVDDLKREDVVKGRIDAARAVMAKATGSDNEDERATGIR